MANSEWPRDASPPYHRGVRSERRWARRPPIAGIAATGVMHLIALGVILGILVLLDEATSIGTALLRLWPVLAMALGVLQLVYVVPAMVIAWLTRRWSFLDGLAIGATVTMLISVAAIGMGLLSVGCRHG